MTNQMHENDLLSRGAVPSAGAGLFTRIAAVTRQMPQRRRMLAVMPPPVAGWIYAASTGLGAAAGLLMPLNASSSGTAAILALIYGGWL